MAHSLLSRGAEHFPYNCKPIYMIELEVCKK